MSQECIYVFMYVLVCVHHWYTSVAFKHLLTYIQPYFGPEIEEEMKNLKKIPNTIYCIAQGYILEKILQTEDNNN